MQKFLSEEEREVLKDQHSNERDRRICDRIKAFLLFDEGWSYGQIAHALLLTDESIRKHIKDYQHSYKLEPQNGGSVSKLKPSQTEELLSHLQENTYLYAKDITAYVREKFSAFKEAVLGFLQSLFNPSKEIQAILQKRITDNFHVIG